MVLLYYNILVQFIKQILINLDITQLIL